MMIHRNRKRGLSGGTSSYFAALLNTPGEAGADAWTICPSTTTFSPTAVYLPQDITTGTGAWAAHAGSVGSLTKQAGTPTYDLRSPFDGGALLDEGVAGDGTAYWLAGSGPALGTKDLVLLVALRWGGDSGTRVVCGTRPGTGGAGFSAYCTSGVPGALFFYLSDGTNSVNPSVGGLAAGQVVVFVAAVNVSETDANCSTAFANAIAGSGAAPTAALGSVSDAAALAIGAYTNGGSPLAATDTVYAVALWEGASMFSAGATGTAEMLAVSKELTYRLSGLWPQRALSGQFCPAVTRATAAGHAVSRSSDSRLWQVGAGLASADNAGLPVWASRQNLLVQSNSINTWTALELTSVSASSKTLGHENAMGIVGNVTDTYHGVRQAPAATELLRYTLSAVLEAGNQTWARLSMYDGATVRDEYFQLSGAGAVGTGGGNYDAAGITSLGNSRYLCWVSATMGAGTTSALCDIYAAVSDGDNTFAGDTTTVNLHVWEDVQFELGDYPSALIRTAGAAVTRNATDVNFDIDNVPVGSAFTIEVPFLLPDHTPAAARTIFSISDGTTDHHLTASVATDGSIDVDSNENGGDAGHVDIAGDYADGAKHVLRVAIGGGSLQARIDSSAIGSDTSATTPTGMTAWKIGRRYDDTLYLNGHIAKEQISLWRGVRI